MRKARAAFRLILPALLLSGGCDQEMRPEPPPDEGGELVRVCGSDDVYPLMQTLAGHFEKGRPDQKVVFAPPTHTRGGAAAISLGDSDVGLLSRPLMPDEKDSSSTYLHLAQDLVAFATHPGVGIEGLERQDILDIYSGKITRWSEVGGPDEPITVLDRAEHTSLKIVLRQQLFGASLDITPEAIVLERPGNMITSLTTVENSIGYLSLGDEIPRGRSVSFLAVDGVQPSVENSRKGLYPFSRPFGILLHSKPSQATMRFIGFTYGEEGRRIMEARGFSPITMDLVIAVLPEQDLLAQEQRYAPLVRYLSRQMGLQTTVELRLLPDYGRVIEEFQAGRVNAAFLGSLAFALAHAQAGVVPIARPEKGGVSQYRGVIVSRKDSGIRSLGDLEGRSFGFVDRATTAGYLFPLLELKKRGIARPEDYLGQIQYTGSHDLLFLKVFGGELEAGAAKDLMLEEVARTRTEIKEGLRVLSVSPPVPNNAFVLRKDLDFPCFRCHELVPAEARESPGAVPRGPEELERMMTDLLLNLHESPAGREVLEALGADRFVRTTVDDLDEVNRMIRQAGFDPETYRP